MSAKAYTRDWGTNGYSVRATKAGWIVSEQNINQGTINGRVTLSAYTDKFPREMDLDAPWNETMSNGDAVKELAPETRVIRKGSRVQ